VIVPHSCLPRAVPPLFAVHAARDLVVAFSAFFNISFAPQVHSNNSRSTLASKPSSAVLDCHALRLLIPPPITQLHHASCGGISCRGQCQ